MPTRRAFLAAATAALAGPARAQPDLAPLDRLMTAFLADHAVPGAALAVARRGRLVYSRAFGLADLDRKTPVRPTSLFRVASVSRPLTAVAVLQLVELGKVRLDDPVMRYVTLRPHLAAGAEVDPRLKDVTVRHCLNHTGGWDRDRSGDPIGIPARIARELGGTPPVSAADVIRYTPCLRSTDSARSYSNVGYLLLGRVVEYASGLPYERYVKERVLAPVGVTTTQLGRALPENRPADEVRYYDSELQHRRCSVFAAGRERCLPRGRRQPRRVRGARRVGGVGRGPGAVRGGVRRPGAVAAAVGGVGTNHVGPAGGTAGHDAKGEPKPAYHALAWNARPVTGGVNAWHTGLISGTSTLLVRRPDGFSWAVLFNTDRSSDGRVLSGVIDPLVHRAVGEVTTWPAWASCRGSDSGAGFPGRREPPAGRESAPRISRTRTAAARRAARTRGRRRPG